MILHELTIKEAAEKLTKGEITSVELTESIFLRIEEVEPKVGAYITFCKEKALEMARASDERRKNGKVLSLVDGIPIAVKDLFLTKGIKTTAASKILEDYIPVYESTVTDKLWKAGAVLIGKTNLDQFAMGSSTETSAYNTSKEFDSTTRNPWDLERIPGGSSGGSAAAVAADLCIAAVGTDTGGSIRQPASHCSITGLKPTYGRVSRYGTIAMASSLDQAGPMTKTVEDAAIMLEIISGYDKYDSTSSKKSVPKYFENIRTSNFELRDLRIGIPKEFFTEGLDPEVEKVVREGIKTLESLGATMVDVSLPLIRYALAVYYILMPAEVSSNLARYDGIRFGYSLIKSKIINHPSRLGSRSEAEKSKLGNTVDSITLEQVYEMSRVEGFGAEAKRRIMLGSYVLSAGYYDAYYKKAEKVRVLLKEEFDKVFQDVDLLITPVSPVPAFKFGEKLNDPLSMYLSDILTVPANPAGLPAISIPAGFVLKGGKELPIGMQLIGPAWSEEKILSVGYAFQSATEWHKKKPKL